MARPALSVSLISLNEADRIRHTLESVKDIAGEIVLVDSGSADETREIALSYGAKVYEEAWKGFAAQKNSSLEKCSGEWILCLDCDEELTPELAEEIKAAIKSPQADGYIINRRTRYLGRTLKRSWQPDNRLRLAKRSASPRWEGELVHEALKVKGKVKRFKNPMIHRSYRGIADHMAKTVKYAELSAADYYRRGKKPSLIKMIFSPCFAFFKLYVLNLAVLDGVPGLVAASSAYMYSFLKYAFLWDMRRREDEKES